MTVFIPTARTDSGSEDNGSAKRNGYEYLEERSNHTMLEKRNAAYDPSSFLDLVMISQPPDTPQVSLTDGDYVFAYDDSAGAGQVVYSLDYGANLANPVSLTTMTFGPALTSAT